MDNIFKHSSCSIGNETNKKTPKLSNMNRSCKKIVVFDFDGTLTRFNIPAELSRIKSMFRTSKNDPFMVVDNALKYMVKNIGLDKIYSELVIDKSFLDLINNMKNQDIRVIIMSYGYNDIIKKLLEAKGYTDLFELVITPADFNLKEGYDQTEKLDGKNVMLNRVSKVYGVRKENIILIDDSFENVKRACQKGYKILHVDSGNGLTLNMLKMIADFVDH